MSDPLSIIGNIASILGVILTFVVMAKVRNLSASYQFQGRAPDLLKCLRASKRNLDEGLKNNLPALIGDALATAKAGLDSLHDKVQGQPLCDKTALARARVQTLLDTPHVDRTERQCRAISEDLTIVIEGLGHMTKDLPWKARDEG